MGKLWRCLLVFTVLSGTGLVLAACAGAATPVAVTSAPQTAATRLPEPTKAPEPSIKPEESPVIQVSPTPPLPTQPAPTPTTVVEARVLELEWPSRLRLGDSDIVRLSLIPSKDGYTVTAEFPEHQVQSQQLPVKRPGGYELKAVALLDGVGFEISPQAEQTLPLPLDERISFLWSLKPRAPGQQRLVVILILRWQPEPGAGGSPYERMVFSKGLDVRVTSFFGLDRGQAMTGGFFGLLFGGGMWLFGLISLFVPARQGLKVLKPNPSLVIEPHPGLALSDEENSLLRAIFNRYGRLVLEREFLSGYSGARTFLALPIRPDGRSDAYTIVKIGPRSSIRQEFENYERFVRDTLPPVTARIQHAPVTASTIPAGIFGMGKAALQYTFIAEPGRLPSSLRQVLLEKPESALLDRLFNTFAPNWWMQRKPYTFRLAQEYDRVLPTHLVIEPIPGRGRVLDGNVSPHQAQLEIGQLVTLGRFSSIEVRPDGRSLALRGEARAGQPPLRVRWLSLDDPRGACGRVVDTRQSLLHEWVKDFDLFGLPDPLESLPAVLNENISGTQSTIHGDLNLENILVGPGDFVWLIDFAQTRDGHTLFDFAHLGAEIIGHILSPQLSPEDHLKLLQGNPSAQFMPLFSLLSSLEAITRRCLFNPSQPREYRLAFALTCLGALKFANLERRGKHLLYLTAAYLISKQYSVFSKGDGIFG